MVTGMMDIYLSSVSNKMNEIMMFLSIIGTIFIPLTFITGIYGMNFKYMPELAWRWSYPVVIAIMFGIGIIMLFFLGKREDCKS
jgi:magnesium transporter